VRSAPQPDGIGQKATTRTSAPEEKHLGNIGDVLQGEYIVDEQNRSKDQEKKRYRM